MDKRYLFLLIGIIIVVSAVVLRVGASNRWVCQDGEWQKRGNPSVNKPQTACSDEWSIEHELKALSALLGKQPPESPVTPAPPIVNEPIATSTDSEKPPVQVELIAPEVNGLISSPYTVRGRAHGSWFFEAVLPVVLTDGDGTVLVQTYGTAVGDWMVDGWVEFTSDLEFDALGAESGYLIIKKDNPSGLPEHDAQVSFPVRLAQ
ncbi:hypothetical protein CVU83_03465 [Candidatus Falkowbacteria bacterium HGW-Falkowbacteria-2]|uniref:Bacterial spore germination immunoglobulin-like domain-containing protein n=1 Tax=Candidatus Falkowbacteria bacterium HGW-Falkowbacteria-2 TaxID=2013769 RepID=A0A2N2DX35_9BACT|nr:MAG: hypothetical protein CVU83_03465 [Candidatus Falkowbacteria bacterium HGW-Falkowbacteria-2]